MSEYKLAFPGVGIDINRCVKAAKLMKVCCIIIYFGMIINNFTYIIH